MIKPKALKPRREAAKREFDTFAPMRDEAYQYAIPFRKSARTTGTGEKRANQAFDHTAVETAFRFAGKLQQDIWPAGQDNFELEPGNFIVDPAERDKVAKGLDPITKVCSAFFEEPAWGLAFHEMAIDLSAGTGAIFMNSSTALDRLWAPMSVAIEEVMIETGRDGMVSGIFWDWELTVRELFETYPDGKFGAELNKLRRETPEKKITVRVDTVWQPAKGNARAGRWVMVVWFDKQDDAIVESRSRTCPWLTPRYFRVPGESYGRGLVHLAMPTIKTLNTAARLQLQAAAIALLGIYTAVDDGVFNPDLSPIQPGMFWKVARNGGSLGKSVEKFPDPRLDLTQLVMQDLRQGVRSTMMDDDLPMAGEAVKSPTEIIERVRKASANHIGAFERLVQEIVVPAVRRVIELAYDKGLIANAPSIDQLLVRVRVKSPIAVARAAARVQRNLEWLQMVFGVEAGKAEAPSVGRIAKVDQLLIEAGRDLGVDEQLITSQEDRDKIDAETREANEARQAAMLAYIAQNGEPPKGMQ